MNIPAHYAPVVAALAPVLYDLPGKLVAISGRPGVGKTTLGRFLAFRFNVSLVETDLFMIEGQDAFVYREQEIARIIDQRLSIPRPVIVEGVTVLRLLASMQRPSDFFIHVTNPNAPECRPQIAAQLDAYDSAFSPHARADIALALDHDG